MGTGLITFMHPHNPPIGSYLLVAMARNGQSSFIAAERITWPTLLSGAIATYIVMVAARPGTGDSLVLSNPEPFTDYPGQVWPNHLLFEQTSVAFPYLMGYEGPAPEEEAEEEEGDKIPKKKKSKHRSRSPSPSPSDSSSSSSSSNASRARKHKRHRSKSKHGGHKHSKRHKHRRHSSSPLNGAAQRDSDSGSGSDSEDYGTTTYKDAGNRPVTRIRGSSMQTIRTSKPLRAFAPPARIKSLLVEVGN
jgi:hypothetical protein